MNPLLKSFLAKALAGAVVLGGTALAQDEIEKLVPPTPGQVPP
jgi:hypothetical protein